MNAPGPFNKEWEPFARAVVEVCKDKLGSGIGIAVMMFDMGASGRMNYMCNAKREDMIAALKELIANLEGRAFDTPETRQ